MILPRSSTLRRWPQFPRDKEMGIKAYGRHWIDSRYHAYKVGIDQADRVERLGYRIVKRGTGYIYVV